MTKLTLFKRCILSLVLMGLSMSVSAEKVIIFGATGNIGKSIVREALDRGHEVVGVSRSPDKFEYTEDNFTGVAGNPTVLESVVQITKDADMIINAVGGRDTSSPEETTMALSAKAFSEAFAGQGEDGPQLVIIGGGLTTHGSKQKLIENLPPRASEDSAFRALFIGHWTAYEIYTESDINWTFVSPPMRIIGFGRTPGEDTRTGKYRTSTEGFVKGADGKNIITKSDLAVAVLDFAEKRNFNQQKVALGY